MTAENNKTREEIKKTTGVNDIVTDVSDVVVAVLGIGEAMAKTFAEVTSSSKKVPKPEEGSNSINAMVHYGMTGITNLLGTAVGAVGGKENQKTNLKQERKLPANHKQPLSSLWSKEGQRCAFPCLLRIRGTNLCKAWLSVAPPWRVNPQHLDNTSPRRLCVFSLRYWM
jgi:hypothetical protein